VMFGAQSNPASPQGWHRKILSRHHDVVGAYFVRVTCLAEQA
jgi:hypothetical protein